MPLYWLALTMRLVVLAAAALAGAKAFPGIAAIVTSYLFIPYDAMGYGRDYLFPVLDLGWTLNYEMFFYLVFSCFIGFARERAVVGFVAFICAGAAIASFFPPVNDVLRYWLQPIIVEFAFGALVALLLTHGVILANWLRLAMVGAALCIWLWIDPARLADLSAPGFYGWSRVGVWGACAVLVVAAFVLGNRQQVTSRWTSMGVGLGDASYAIYLLHPFIFIPIKGALALLVIPAALLWPMTAVVAGITIAIAYVIHRSAEVPILKLLKVRVWPSALSLTPAARPVPVVGHLKQDRSR